MIHMQAMEGLSYYRIENNDYFLLTKLTKLCLHVEQKLQKSFDFLHSFIGPTVQRNNL